MGLSLWYYIVSRRLLGLCYILKRVAIEKLASFTQERHNHRGMEHPLNQIFCVHEGLRFCFKYHMLFFSPCLLKHVLMEIEKCFTWGMSTRSTFLSWHYSILVLDCRWIARVVDWHVGIAKWRNISWYLFYGLVVGVL